MNRWNTRQKTAFFLLGVLGILLIITVAGPLLTGRAVATDLTRKNLPPSLAYLFGTDQLGRDMLSRTLSGLSLSIRIGVLTAAVSALIALALGLAAATLGPKVDAAVGFLIDFLMGIPHILLLILVSLAFGRGFQGVVAAMSLTHWPSLARLLRGEILQLKSRIYIQAAEKLGLSRWSVAKRHLLPHLLPQFITGTILLFPHAILHEASLTFLGFGLSPEQPAIGVILSESMQYLVTGKWWLSLFPGLMLVLVVALFSAAGERIRRLTDPGSIHE